MHPILILINLAAAVMLLLYAVRMVRTGIERAHGAALRDRLQGASGNRVTAALGGMVLAMLLQSATAVGVLAAGFAASGIVTRRGWRRFWGPTSARRWWCGCWRWICPSWCRS